MTTEIAAGGHLGEALDGLAEGVGVMVKYNESVKTRNG